MPPTSAAEEIIEKKTGSPIATSCLILAAVALLGAIAFQVAELGEYRKGASAQANIRMPGAKAAKSEAENLKGKVDAIILKGGPAADAGDAAPADDEGKPAPDDPKDEPDATKDDVGEPTDEGDKAKDDADADTAGDTKPAADPPAADAEEK